VILFLRISIASEELILLSIIIFITLKSLMERYASNGKQIRTINREINNQPFDFRFILDVNKNAMPKMINAK
jgi:hypothetical protein